MPFLAELGIEAVRLVFLAAVAAAAVISGRKVRDFKYAKKDTEA